MEMKRYETTLSHAKNLLGQHFPNHVAFRSAIKYSKRHLKVQGCDNILKACIETL